MSGRLEFFFDYGSPYSYLANTQLPGLVARTRAELVYRPMLLGGVYKATGNRSPAQEPVEPKRRYGAVELARFVAHYGVEFRSNPFFPINTLPIMRCCVAAQHGGVFDAFHRAVYPAFWVEGLDLGDAQVFGSVLERAGLDAKRLVELSTTDDVKAELRASTDEAVARGVFGAPTFFVGKQMFFGADRMDFVSRALGAQDLRGART